MWPQLVTLAAPAGADLAVGGAQSRSTSGCTISGTPGDDLLVGTGRADVICGRGGDDRIRGGDGDDRILGGAGDDTVDGGGGGDVLTGNAGTDRVRGGPGADDLRGEVTSGGTGADFCTGPGRRTGCERDTADPVLAGDRASSRRVDVTAADRSVVLSVRITDDIGVSGVNLSLVDGDADGSGHEFPWSFNSTFATLRSGTARDGVWTATVLLPRYAAPGDYRIRVAIGPRRGPERVVLGHATLTVRSDQPDEQPPELGAMTRPAIGVVAHRSESLPVRVHLTDALAGVDLVWLCLRPVSGVTPGTCSRGLLVGGDRHDSVWAARLALARVPVGPAEVDVTAYDRIGTSRSWWGPEAVAAAPEGAVPAIPGGFGPVTVVR